MQSELLLRFFEQVRQKLVTAGIRELAGDWDIREENVPGLLGYCHSTQLGEWTAISDDTKVAPFRVDYVGMRLVPEDNVRSACPDDLESLFSAADHRSEASDHHHLSYCSSSSSSTDHLSYCSSSSPTDQYSSNSTDQYSSNSTDQYSSNSTDQYSSNSTDQYSSNSTDHQRTSSTDSDRFYPLETLLPTLLHEFAHVLAPCCLRLRSETGKRSRKWRPDSHGPEFYQAFARVLRVAEELAIFALPNTANKLSRKSLSRFDRIDLESFQLSAATVLPQSRQLFAASEQLDPSLPASDAPPPVYPLRLTFAATVKGKPAQKPVVIDRPMSWQEFMRFAKDKLHMARLPTSVRDHSGAAIDESGLQRLSQDQRLVFAAKASGL